MKLQERYFHIKKISYPNSDTRHGKFKIELMTPSEAQSKEVFPNIFTLQMVKECAQIMAHEKFLISYIKEYCILSPILPAKTSNLLIEIRLQQTDKEGTGIVYQMKASGASLGKTELKYFEIIAELSPIK